MKTILRTRWIAFLLLNVTLVLGMAFSLFGAQSALARDRSEGPYTWFVAPTGNDSSSCLAPGSPCLTINAALEKAAATEGDIIKVAIGTYTGTGEQAVLIEKDVSLLGGWNPAFTAQTGFSTIDGEQARTGIRVNGGVFVAIDHFEIQGGRGGIGGGIGGGIVNLGVLSVDDSLIHDNASVSGAGIRNFGILIVNDTTIRNNAAGVGGTGGGGGGGHK
jgi:hypothetical protein